MQANQRGRSERLLLTVLLRLPEYILGVLVGALVIFMTAAVFVRYVLHFGTGGATEGTELLFVWIVFLGFAVALKHRANVGVDMVVDRLPRGLRRAAFLLQDITVLAFSVIFTKESFVTMRFAFMQRLPGLQISMAWLYAAVVVAGILMTVYAGVNLWLNARGKGFSPDPVRDDIAQQSG